MFYNSEISSISDGQARALQMRQSKSFFPVRLTNGVVRPLKESLYKWKSPF